MPPLPGNVFRGAKLAYELAYGKGLTPFLQAARAEGVAKLADGVGMLVEQAAEAFAWWRGVRTEHGSGHRRADCSFELTGAMPSMLQKSSFLVGLIGSGIAASRTPPMHEAAADAAGIRYLYKRD